MIKDDDEASPSHLGQHAKQALIPSITTTKKSPPLETKNRRVVWVNDFDDNDE